MGVLRIPQTVQRQGIYYADKPDRTAKSGQELYAEFVGVLQCDGYSVYASVDCRDRVGCLAHVYRKFFEATKRDRRAKRPLKILDQMFHLEKQWQTLSSNERKKLCKQRLASLLKKFCSVWLNCWLYHNQCWEKQSNMLTVKRPQSTS